VKAPASVLLLATVATVVLVLERADTRAQAPAQSAASTIAMHADPDTLFKSGGTCMPCHNGLTTPSGEDVSIGIDWRASMMANSSRDPYWQAAVRREVTDHPAAAAEIEDECATCHMPMSRATARANDAPGRVFDHLPVTEREDDQDLLAHDGVSCTMCHQISSDKLGTPASFTGGFSIAGKQPTPRPIFGPFQIDRGLSTVMRSSAEFQPTEGLHVRSSELCATCHTLITRARGAQGAVIGELPEQVMFQEWQHSAFRAEQRSCQSCHMPVVRDPTPITSVAGQPREGLARHVFVGGNFFMLRMLNRYRQELGVAALPAELEASARRTVANLQEQTAAVSVSGPALAAGRLNFDVTIADLTGHKFPTGYPSRRAWLHVTVRDAAGRVVFESGAIRPTGLIDGNDNDADPARFEPHYAEIREPDQVQIYESIMGDTTGRPTTGLLTGVRYLKDNRLLPRGFDKATASDWIKVIGDAAQDPDFTGGSDRVRYSIAAGASAGPHHIEVELRFQPISFRWAQNLKAYDSPEPKRFVGWFESMSAGSSEIIAKAAAR
jgi:hypothetical protein